MAFSQQPKSHAAEGRSVQWAGQQVYFLRPLWLCLPSDPMVMTSITVNPAGTQTLESWRTNTTLLLKLFQWVSVYINCRYLLVSHRFVCVHVCPCLYPVYVFGCSAKQVMNLQFNIKHVAAATCALEQTEDVLTMKTEAENLWMCWKENMMVLQVTDRTLLRLIKDKWTLTVKELSYLNVFLFKILTSTQCEKKNKQNYQPVEFSVLYFNNWNYICDWRVTMLLPVVHFGSVQRAFISKTIMTVIKVRFVFA